MDDVIFAVRRYASAIYAVVVCLYVREREKEEGREGEELEKVGPSLRIINATSRNLTLRLTRNG